MGQGASVMLGFTSFVPLILLSLIVLAFAWPMTARKGLSPVYALICLVPFVGYFALIWIASQPDREILDRLARLEARL